MLQRYLSELIHLYKNGRESVDNLPFCTQGESVLELLYKDLLLLHELRTLLKQEGLIVIQ